MLTSCPNCQSTRIFASRIRSRWETIRRTLTRKRPYRCHVCDWRGWGPPGWGPGELSFIDKEFPPESRHAPPVTGPEMDYLDPSDTPTGDSPAGKKRKRR